MHTIERVDLYLYNKVSVLRPLSDKINLDKQYWYNVCIYKYSPCKSGQTEGTSSISLASIQIKVN